MDIQKMFLEADALEPECIRIRRDFHKYPAIAGSWHGLYATTKFTAKFTGKSAHAGAAPEERHSAVLAAAAAIMMMQGFLQDGRGSGRLNVGVIHGGTSQQRLRYGRVLPEGRREELSGSFERVPGRTLSH